MSSAAPNTMDLTIAAEPVAPVPPVPQATDDPSREIRFGVGVAVLFFVLFLGWAAFARLDAAAFAPGRLAVTGQRQTVQHREGGVISAILVREGSKVSRGQVLIRLAGADVRAQERALTAQAIGLLAQRARLNAEQAGRPSITVPPEFAALAPEDRPQAIEALRIQQNQLRTRAAVLGAQRGALGQRTAQARSSGQGYSRQVAAIDQQIRLVDQELEGLKEAAAKGFVSQNRLRALERVRADLEGQRGQYSATIDQTRSQAGESRLQALEAQSNYMERVATELREVEASLNDVLPKLAAARDQLARTEIRAPVAGTVVGLTVFTPGGVIEPGQRLMDIVPEAAPLTIEAKVGSTDGDDVRVGQLAFVRFESIHDRTLPALRGQVSRISADAFSDEKTGISYYTAEIAVPRSELKRIENAQGSTALRPGLPVTVNIPLRRRTALEYALEPLLGAVRRSFHEQ
jgi:HlyD family type I secretion membrane fusion protein